MLLNRNQESLSFCAPVELETFSEQDFLMARSYGLLASVAKSPLVKEALLKEGEILSWYFDWLLEVNTDIDEVVEIGCQFGGRALELSGFFEFAYGLDWRADFIREGTKVVSESKFEVQLNDSELIVDNLNQNLCDRTSLAYVDITNLHPEYLNAGAVVISELPSLINKSKWLENHLERGLLKENGTLLILAPLNDKEFRHLDSKLNIVDLVYYPDIIATGGGNYIMIENEASLWQL